MTQLINRAQTLAGNRKIKGEQEPAKGRCAGPACLCQTCSYFLWGNKWSLVRCCPRLHTTGEISAPAVQHMLMRVSTHQQPRCSAWKTTASMFLFGWLWSKNASGVVVVWGTSCFTMEMHSGRVVCLLLFTHKKHPMLADKHSWKLDTLYICRESHIFKQNGRN